MLWPQWRRSITIKARPHLVVILLRLSELDINVLIEDTEAGSDNTPQITTQAEAARIENDVEYKGSQGKSRCDGSSAEYSLLRRTVKCKKNLGLIIYGRTNGMDERQLLRSSTPQREAIP